MIDYFRVYFNRRGTAAKAWSVDTGQGTKRRHFSEVHIITHHVITTHNTGESPDWENPVAWIEVWGKLSTKDGRALITWAPEPTHKKGAENG